MGLAGASEPAETRMVASSAMDRGDSRTPTAKADNGGYAGNA